MEKKQSSKHKPGEFWKRKIQVKKQELQTQASPQSIGDGSKNLRTEDKVEEINTFVKESIKSKKFLIQNIQEIWDTM